VGACGGGALVAVPCAACRHPKGLGNHRGRVPCRVDVGSKWSQSPRGHPVTPLVLARNFSCEGMKDWKWNGQGDSERRGQNYAYEIGRGFAEWVDATAVGGIVVVVGEIVGAVVGACVGCIVGVDVVSVGCVVVAVVVVVGESEQHCDEEEEDAGSDLFVVAVACILAVVVATAFGVLVVVGAVADVVGFVVAVAVFVVDERMCVGLDWGES
jgi:hypothetical protein